MVRSASSRSEGKIWVELQRAAQRRERLGEPQPLSARKFLTRSLGALSATQWTVNLMSAAECVIAE
jgi:hypothetical protein